MRNKPPHLCLNKGGEEKTSSENHPCLCAFADLGQEASRRLQWLEKALGEGTVLALCWSVQ